MAWSHAEIVCKFQSYCRYGVHEDLVAASLCLVAFHHNRAGVVSRIKIQYCASFCSVGRRDCMSDILVKIDVGKLNFCTVIIAHYKVWYCHFSKLDIGGSGAHDACKENSTFCAIYMGFQEEPNLNRELCRLRRHYNSKIKLPCSVWVAVFSHWII